MSLTDTIAFDSAMDITRDHAACILAQLGFDLDDQNFATDRRTGARCWAGLGSWQVRVANIIHVQGEMQRARERGRVAA